MFSDSLDHAIQLAAKIGSLPVLPSGEFAELLAKASQCPLGDDEIVDLINGTRSKENGEIVLDYAAAYRRPHDREVLLLPPLYLSSICENVCHYCNFRKQGKRLDLGEFEREFSCLLDLGFRSIELVSSQDPKLFCKRGDYSLTDQHFQIDSFLSYVEIASRLLGERGGGMLTTNIPPLDVESMRRMHAGGVDCSLVWQETFNSRQYARIHSKKDPKFNQRFRLDSMENALAAGVPHLAGAFLKGLYDWRQEEVVLYLYDRHLKSANRRGLSIIGTPRIKGDYTASAEIRCYQVSDRDYELNIALDRILFDGILWLQTRESLDFNRNLIRRFGGGIILTLLCSTAPGGYALPTRAKAQFPVFSENLQESVRLLEADGFSVRFDWDGRVLSTFQRSMSERGTPDDG